MLIEVIGIPGAGKSTFLKKLFKNNNTNKFFADWKHVKKEAISNFYCKIDRQSTKTNMKYFKVFSSIPIINTHFSNYFLYKKIKYSTEIYDGYWGTLSEIILNEIMKNDLLPPNMKPYYINLILAYIVRARLLKEYSIKINKNIIFENGIISAINTIEDIEKNKIHFKKQILPDLIVFIKANMETIIGVAENRRKEKSRVLLLSKDNDEISKIYENSLNKYIKLTETLSKEGIRIIEIDRDDSPEKLINKLNIKNK